MQGYTYSVFNLVYETNVASCRIWDALGFKRIGRIKSCGNLRSHPDDLVDAIIYGRDLGPEGEDFVSEERFDKIRYYLKHGTYPSGADRAEKSRLRSAATHYKLLPDENGQGERLMLKDKEVVSDPQRQYEIARTVHASQHGGINKTTATIAEKFHWVRIKETVSLVIKNCPDCKESTAKAPTVRPMSDGNGVAYGQPRRATNGNGQNVDPNSMIERLVNFDQMEPSNSITNRSPPKPSPLPRHTTEPRIHALHDYNDIPLDPQIMGHQPPHHHPADQYIHHHPSPSSTSYPPQPNHHNDIHNNDQYMNLDIDPSPPDPQPQQMMTMKADGPHPPFTHDTRMATERHVREGDEPMAYQDGHGIIHDVKMPDGVIDGETRDEEVDLEELLRRE